MRFNKINRQILALAIPSIIANITTPLLALVDTAVVGHMGSAMFIAAIAVGGSIFNMVYWMFGFLRMGSSGLTAQEWGRGDMKSCYDVLRRSLVIALAAGILIILLCRPLLSAMLFFMDTDHPTSALVDTYFSILVFGAPAVLANYSLTGWFLGMQNSRITMWISVLINVTNIAVSLVLVFIFHLGISGVAVGTLVAQWVGCLAGFMAALRYGFSFREFSMRSIFEKSGIKRFFSINFDIFLRTVCLIAVTLWFTREGSRQGITMLAVNTLLMQYFIIFSYFMDGFAFAGEALAGRYLGASDAGSFRLTVNRLLRWGTGIAFLFTILYVAGGDLLLHLLSDDAGVVASAHEFRWWAATIPFAGFAAFIWDGIFIGVTHTRQMLLSMVYAMAVFFISLYFFKPSLSNHGLWLSFILYLVTRGIVLAIFYFRSVRGKLPVE